jgi:hypothetical protein
VAEVWTCATSRSFSLQASFAVRSSRFGTHGLLMRCIYKSGTTRGATFGINTALTTIAASERDL